MTAPDRKLAKDVATEIEKRRRRRKVIIIAIWAAAIAAAIFYMQCGRGWGLGGGKGKGAGTGSAVPGVTDAGPQRCSVRVTAKGIFVDGNEMKRDEAVAACKKTEGAMVTVTGDARQGDWDELRAALEAVGVKIFVRGDVGDFGEPGSGSAGSGSN